MLSKRKQVAVWAYLCSTRAMCYSTRDAELLGQVDIMTGGLLWDGDQYWVYMNDCLVVQFIIVFNSLPWVYGRKDRVDPFAFLQTEKFSVCTS